MWAGVSALTLSACGNKANDPSPPSTSAGAAGTSAQAGADPGGGAGTLGAGSGGAGADSGGNGGASAGAAGSGGNAGTSSAPFGHADPTVTAPKYDGFTLWVVEDFAQPLDLNHDPIWTWSDGGFETHRFRREALSFEPGKMVITLSETPQASSCSYANTGISPSMKKTSGELRSKHNWFRYGRYEVRLKAPLVKPNDPTVNGNYLLSLFTYRQPACQEWREIDLEVTGDTPNHLSTNLITSDKDCNFTSSKEQPQALDLPGNFRTDFQTIGFEWLPTSIKFYYLDEAGSPVIVRTLTGAKVPTLSGKIMANLWVFNETFAFGGPMGKNNVYPMRAEYDFVRFYRWDGDTEYPCSDMSTKCLKPEDLDLTGNNGCDGIGFSGDLSTCGQCGTVQRVQCVATCESTTL